MFKIARALPQRADSEDTRKRIFDTALSLFREQGFDATTIREIAARTGLSLGAAYYYFPSKEAIVAAYYEHVQERHRELAQAAFATTTTLKDRLRAAYHTKLDVMQDDQRLLRALFRYGGEPEHPLSWFGPASRAQRDASMAVFAEAVEGERLPDDVRLAAPVLLWTLHMGVLLYFLYDTSPNAQRTRRLVDAAVDFVVDVKRIATLPLMRPVRRRVLSVLKDAGLMAA
ncbi:MAG TPA: TetR/AcrR family transcriptional regulator [Vicinamibacterales bacterium]|nr:TetR/AcrR family transcriptional regulator [Vicinamibacterales bacterium]